MSLYYSHCASSRGQGSYIKHFLVPATRGLGKKWSCVILRSIKRTQGNKALVAMANCPGL